LHSRCSWRRQTYASNYELSVIRYCLLHGIHTPWQTEIPAHLLRIALESVCEGYSQAAPRSKSVERLRRPCSSLRERARRLR
jgi:hypothetical protein